MLYLSVLEAGCKVLAIQPGDIFIPHCVMMHGYPLIMGGSNHHYTGSVCHA